MSENGWLKDVLRDVRSEVASWPQWMKNAGTSTPGNVTSHEPTRDAADAHPKAPVKSEVDDLEDRLEDALMKSERLHESSNDLMASMDDADRELESASVIAGEVEQRLESFVYGAGAYDSQVESALVLLREVIKRLDAAREVLADN